MLILIKNNERMLAVGGRCLNLNKQYGIDWRYEAYYEWYLKQINETSYYIRFIGIENSI